MPAAGGRVAARSVAANQRAATRTVGPCRVGRRRVAQCRVAQCRVGPVDHRWADPHRADRDSGVSSLAAIPAGQRSVASAIRAVASNSVTVVVAASRSATAPADRAPHRERPTAYPLLAWTARPKRRPREASPGHAPARRRLRRAGRPAGSRRRAGDPRSRPRRPSNAGSPGRPDPCTSRTRFRSLVAFRRRCRLQRDQAYRLRSCPPVPREAIDARHVPDAVSNTAVLNTVARPVLDSSVARADGLSVG